MSAGAVIAARADDQITAAIKTVKAARSDALEKADTALVAAFGDVIKVVAATGDLDATKAVIAERDAFQKSKTFPQSKAMADAVSDYVRAREAADKELLHAYDDAISARTKELMVDEATKLQSERKTFAANETKIIAGISGKGADAKSQGKPEKPVSTKEFMNDLVSRLDKAIDKIAKEPTTARRDKLHSDMISSFGEELRSKKLTFRFRIRDISRVSPTSREFAISIGPPEEMDGVQAPGSLTYCPLIPETLSQDEIDKTKPGDVIIVTGMGRLLAQPTNEGYAGGLGDGRSSPAGHLVIVVIESGVSKYEYGIFLQNHKYKIEHK
jgi:hypothetical protein